MKRTAKVTRKTLETNISVEINIDGSGKSDLNSGIGFLDHMLEQISRHGLFDLTVKAEGDYLSQLNKHQNIVAYLVYNNDSSKYKVSPFFLDM